MKYWIITFGCQMNKSDSERIASVLEKSGYKRALGKDEADLIVVNMCSVRQSAVDRIFGLSQKFGNLKFKNPDLKTVLTGCILKKDKKNLKKYFDYILDIKNLPNWPKIIKFHRLARGSKNPQYRAIVLRGNKKYESSYLNIGPKYLNDSSAFIPISNGCNNFCSYCVVPYARGKETCRPAEDILCEVKKLIGRGYKEIWLLGQNVNSYKDKSSVSKNSRSWKFGHTDFPKLLKMVNDIPGNFSIRFTSPHPKNFSDELIEVMAKCKKITKYVNLPVQSGDDKILKKMNRNYTVAEYKKLVKKIRKKMPDINLSTDVIVGFPGETKKQFENTAQLFKDIGFNIAYVSKYSPRPGTAAAKMNDNVSIGEKKRREKILREILKKARFNLADLMQKIIVIVGPTASGKTDLSIKLAKRFNGEIVSADSRQVYKGMDIGTGKITKKEMAGIPHYLLNVVSPKTRFTVSQYQKLAFKAIDKIHKKGKIPFLVGGTGFYIQSVVDGIVIPKVRPDWKLRKQLEKKSAEELFLMFKKIDPKRADSIDRYNPRRLIRALEIVLKTGTPVPELKRGPTSPKTSLSFLGGRASPGLGMLQIGIKKSPEELKKSIHKRLIKRLGGVRPSSKSPMINEVKKLHTSGLSWKRLEEFGLEYRFIAQYLQGKINYKEMIDKIQKESEHFAKRQMTWFKRDKGIKWIKNYKEAFAVLTKFLGMI